MGVNSCGTAFSVLLISCKNLYSKLNDIIEVAVCTQAIRARTYASAVRSRVRSVLLRLKLVMDVDFPHSCKLGLNERHLIL
jgi:hypothetical protein